MSISVGGQRRPAAADDGEGDDEDDDDDDAQRRDRKCPRSTQDGKFERVLSRLLCVFLRGCFSNVSQPRSHFKLRSHTQLSADAKPQLHSSNIVSGLRDE